MIENRYSVGDYVLVKDSEKLVKVKDMESIDDVNLYYTSDSNCYPENKVSGYHDSLEYQTIFTITELRVKTKSEEKVKRLLISHFQKTELERFNDFIEPYLTLVQKISVRSYVRNLKKKNFFGCVFRIS